MKQQWKLTLSYDGTLFHGWQVQPGLPTIQDALAKALRELTGESALPQGSGRTDAGVHALAQVASVALEAAIPGENLMRALNRILPSSIRIDSVLRVLPDFHARKSARAKTYEYRIFQRRLTQPAEGHAAERICSPFVAPYVWDCRWPLRVVCMQEASAAVCGTHDFTSFTASDPDRTRRTGDGTSAELNPVKTIWSSRWFVEDDLLIYQVRGSGFLHHMVRNLVGTFVDVGRGAIDPAALPDILAARSRSAAGATAPARGLFLKSVEYDEDTLGVQGLS